MTDEKDKESQVPKVAPDPEKEQDGEVFDGVLRRMLITPPKEKDEKEGKDKS